MSTAMKAPSKDARVSPPLRVAKGKKPQYFSDPTIDKLVSMLISLAGELSVTRERLDSLERLLEREGILGPGQVDSYLPPEEIEAIREEKRARFIERLMRVVEAQHEEITRPDWPSSREEILKALD